MPFLWTTSGAASDALGESWQAAEAGRHGAVHDRRRIANHDAVTETVNKAWRKLGSRVKNIAMALPDAGSRLARAKTP